MSRSWVCHKGPHVHRARASVKRSRNPSPASEGPKGPSDVKELTEGQHCPLGAN